MAWPTPQDYNEAVQSPQTSFADSDLKMGQVETTKLGLPRPISGRFAVVYNVRCGARNFAVRCFQGEVPDQQERYAAISEHLKKARLPYTVSFEFLKDGIRIRGQWYPILKMEWIAGEPLHTYVGKHLRDPASIIRLATDWITMTEALQKAALAHGDLQDGNVLVAKDGLKLIDYDGMFVPALAGKTSNEAGHRNYQHPNRTALDYGPFLDNFSNWVVYVSLVALALDPSLWTRLNGGDECLLFRKEDFVPNGKSQALTALSEHNDPRLQNLGSLFASLLYLMPAQIPPLAANAAIDSASLAPQASSPPNSSNQPSWLNDHVKPSVSSGTKVGAISPAQTSSAASTPVVSPSWILDFITPATARKTFELPMLKLRLIMATLLIFILTLPMLGNVDMDIFGESLLLALLGTIPFFFYRREPAVQERSACLKEEHEQQTVLAGLQQAVRSQENKIVQIRSEEKKAKISLEKEQELIRQAEQRARNQCSAELKTKMDVLAVRQQLMTRPLTKLQSDYQAGLVRSNQKVVECNNNQVQEINTTLQPLQRQFIQDFLQSARIDTARISGIGAKMAANLRASGYITAANVTWGVQNVSGIGNNKASALMSWRQAVENEARRKMPTSLSKSQIDAIVAKYETQRQEIQHRAMLAKTQFETQEMVLKQQTASTELELRLNELPLSKNLDSRLRPLLHNIRHNTLRYSSARRV